MHARFPSFSGSTPLAVASHKYCTYHSSASCSGFLKNFLMATTLLDKIIQSLEMTRMLLPRWNSSNSTHSVWSTDNHLHWFVWTLRICFQNADTPPPPPRHMDPIPSVQDKLILRLIQCTNTTSPRQWTQGSFTQGGKRDYARFSSSSMSLSPAKYCVMTWSTLSVIFEEYISSSFSSNGEPTWPSSQHWNYMCKVSN